MKGESTALQLEITPQPELTVWPHSSTFVRSSVWPGFVQSLWTGCQFWSFVIRSRANHGELHGSFVHLRTNHAHSMVTRSYARRTGADRITLQCHSRPVCSLYLNWTEQVNKSIQEVTPQFITNSTTLAFIVNRELKSQPPPLMSPCVPPAKGLASRPSHRRHNGAHACRQRGKKARGLPSPST